MTGPGPGSSYDCDDRLETEYNELVKELLKHNSMIESKKKALEYMIDTYHEEDLIEAGLLEE